ncbi:MAG: hypothetical protein ACN4GG_05595 [Akkermansiaceae bacterium]
MDKEKLAQLDELNAAVNDKKIEYEILMESSSLEHVKDRSQDLANLQLKAHDLAADIELLQEEVKAQHLKKKEAAADFLKYKSKYPLRSE